MPKAFLTPTYTFTPGASGVGTVNLSGISPFDVKRLAAIINQTRGVTIYATGAVATRYTAVSGTTLTLFVDTTGHSSGDVLQVIYDDPTALAVSGTVTANTGLSQPLTDAQLRASAVPVTGAITSANLNIPGIIQDVASAAFTTVGTLATSTITPTFGCSYVVAIPVTAVTGTTPTYDVVVQESDDGGTNWVDVYHIPRITATGIYRSPKIPLSGNRVRYNQTGGGTTPSFTRSIQRLQSSDSVSVYRQLIDRAISLTTLNAATSALTVQGCCGVQLVINLGAATTAPTLALEGSDDNGATWYALGTLLGVASSTVQITVPGISPQQVRARVSVVGATVTSGYVLVRGY